MTQLFCVIPTCRVPGEHRPGCDGDCRYGCQPRLATEGYACDSCVGYQHQLLGVIADLAPDARAVAAGQARPGATRNGGSSNKPGSQSPLNDGATDELDDIAKGLTKTARDIATVRGPQSLTALRSALTHPLPLTGLCKWLSGSLTWARGAVDDHGQPYAVTVHTAIRDAANRIRAIVNGPGARRYLGPCGAEVVDEDPPDDVFAGCPNTGRCLASWDCHAGRCEPIPAPTCDGDVYGQPGAVNGTCRTCGATVTQDERRQWLDEQVAGQAFRAAHIANAYGISANTIRSWATEHPQTTAKNGTIIRRGRPAKLHAHGRDQQGRPLYLVADVLALARQAAQQRAQNQAQRADVESAGQSVQ